MSHIEQPEGTTARHPLGLPGFVLFKGNRYSIKAIKNNLSSAPKIIVKVSELHADHELLRPASGDFEAGYGEFVVAKYEGKYILLLGRENFEAQQILKKGLTEFQARLLSNPMLKRCLD